MGRKPRHISVLFALRERRMPRGLLASWKTLKLRGENPEHCQLAQHILRPDSRLAVVGNLRDQLLLASDMAVAFRDVPIGLREMPALPIRIVRCAPSSTRRPASVIFKRATSILREPATRSVDPPKTFYNCTGRCAELRAFSGFERC